MAPGSGKDKNGIPIVKPPSLADLNKVGANFGSNRDVLNAHNKELKTKATVIEAQLSQ